MGRYNGPKARINRRLGAMVYETNGAIKAYDRRNYPPGMFTRRGKLSTFGTGLYEKQKIKHYYGLREAQLRKYYDKASRMSGNTGDQLLLLCERRLDNVIRRAGLTKTRLQARQGVVHNHIMVNGVKVNKPSFSVRPGDVITIRNRTNLKAIYRQYADENTIENVSWLHFDPDELKITVTGYPGHDDITIPIEVGLVIEFMAL